MTVPVAAAVVRELSGTQRKGRGRAGGKGEQDGAPVTVRGPGKRGRAMPSPSTPPSQQSPQKPKPVQRAGGDEKANPLVPPVREDAAAPPVPTPRPAVGVDTQSHNTRSSHPLSQVFTVPHTVPRGKRERKPSAEPTTRSDERNVNATRIGGPNAVANASVLSASNLFLAQLGLPSSSSSVSAELSATVVEPQEGQKRALAALDPTPTSREFIITINGSPALVSRAEPFVHCGRLFSRTAWPPTATTFTAGREDERGGDAAVLLLQDCTAAYLAQQRHPQEERQLRQALDRIRTQRDVLRVQRERLRGRRRRRERNGASFTPTPPSHLLKASTTVSSRVEGVARERGRGKEEEEEESSRAYSASTPTSPSERAHSSSVRREDSDEDALRDQIDTCTAHIRALTKALDHFPPPLPPHVLLLPSVTTGCVRVWPGHHYRTVKFVGEHLCLSGQLVPYEGQEQQQQQQSVSRDGDARGHRNDPASGAAPRVPSSSSTPMPASHPDDGLPSHARRRRHHSDEEEDVEEEEWANRELVGLLCFLQHHPSQSAEDYLALNPEEQAKYQTEATQEQQQ